MSIIDTVKDLDINWPALLMGVFTSSLIIAAFHRDLILGIMWGFFLIATALWMIADELRQGRLQ